jgi:hypothetical protein
VLRLSGGSGRADCGAASSAGPPPAAWLTTPGGTNAIGSDARHAAAL